MLGGNSFYMDDCLGDGGSTLGRCFSTHFRLHALGGDFPILSLQFLEDKQHLGGEDCNVPKISMKLIGTLIFPISARR